MDRRADPQSRKKCEAGGNVEIAVFNDPLSSSLFKEDKQVVRERKGTAGGPVRGGNEIIKQTGPDSAVAQALSGARRKEFKEKSGLNDLFWSVSPGSPTGRVGKRGLMKTIGVLTREIRKGGKP